MRIRLIPGNLLDSPIPGVQQKQKSWMCTFPRNAEWELWEGSQKLPDTWEALQGLGTSWEWLDLGSFLLGIAPKAGIVCPWVMEKFCSIHSWKSWDSPAPKSLGIVGSGAAEVTPTLNSQSCYPKEFSAQIPRFWVELLKKKKPSLFPWILFFQRRNTTTTLR